MGFQTNDLERDAQDDRIGALPSGNGRDAAFALTRSVAAAGSRWRVLAATLGGALGLLSRAHAEDAVGAGACKPACSECQSWMWDRVAFLHP